MGLCTFGWRGVPVGFEVPGVTEEPLLAARPDLRDVPRDKRMKALLRFAVEEEKFTIRMKAYGLTAPPDCIATIHDTEFPGDTELLE